MYLNKVIFFILFLFSVAVVAYSLTDNVLTNSCYVGGEYLNCKLMKACTTDTYKETMCKALLAEANADKRKYPEDYNRVFEQYKNEVSQFDILQRAKAEGNKEVIASIKVKPTYDGFCKPGELNTEKQLSCMLTTSCVREDLVREDLESVSEALSSKELLQSEDMLVEKLNFTKAKIPMSICKSILLSSKAVETEKQADDLLNGYLNLVIDYVRSSVTDSPLDLDSTFLEE